MGLTARDRAARALFDGTDAAWASLPAHRKNPHYKTVDTVLSICQPQGAVDEAKRLRLIIADLIEGESAEEGTPKWYALRNAASALGDAS